MFIHIRPEETQTLRRIPRALLFPAPGLPKGHVLMGYGDQGQCPMFVNNQCSIYEDRPQTCRDYDCRVFAATGVLVDAETQPEIARRVQEWAFTYAAEEGREKDRSVKAAAAFLTKNKDLFPSGSLPGYPVQLAALAVRVRRVISQMSARDHRDKAPLGDAAIASGILEEIREDTPGRK
jgi:Fe-S-cluster containining protein